MIGERTLAIIKPDAVKKNVIGDIITTTGVSEQLRESLRTAGINVGSITVTAPSAFRVEGVPADKDAQFRAAADEVASTQYDRNPLPKGSTLSIGSGRSSTA